MGTRSEGDVDDRDERPRSYWRWSKQDFFPEKSFENWGAYRSALSQTSARFKDRLLSQEAHNHAGPAIVLSYVASGISAMLSVFCYTEFAVEIPVSGGSFAYLRVELGDLAAFITAGNILLESIVGTAAVARAWTSYFTTLLNRHPDSLRIRTNLIAGFAHAKASNLKPFLPHGAEGMFKAAAIVYFAYGGFDNIATMAEETKNPSRDIPLGLIGSMSIITLIYCLMALSLSMMQKYTDIDTNAAYSVAFQSVGMTWAKYLVALGALKGMTTVLLVGALGQARYTTHIARAHMIPPWFALVHPKTGTPIYATLLVAISSACIAFFSSLDELSSLLSVSTLFIFMMMAVALLVRRYYVRGTTPRTNLVKLMAFLLIIVSSSMATSAYWGGLFRGVIGNWIGYTVTIPLWFIGTLGIAVYLPQEREARVWGVPLVPWLPSLSIATNLFLMGSLGAKTFIRFIACTVIMLVYYLFFGLHATYDMAHPQIKNMQDKEEKNPSP
ncbi:cationic amino acid transporter 5 [Dorcoceras hygrometricum]|uniref:Cationic amino acid transporter 5 n=1 Tax=Dorcoceras hygrometricum TaxID=472368 RepID=A0A2Z7CJ56_9LAMI|nr:cationic amino acid transporter 5 [Dorcoceras hygrometricum]